MTDTDDGGGNAGPGGLRLPVPVGWRAVLFDLLVVAAWVGIATYGWGLFRWPTWAYYVVVFAGIVGYSVVDDPWAPGGEDAT